MEKLYPKLDNDKITFMVDKQKALQEKLIHYKKIKRKWSIANTVLKSLGFSVSCILAGASILTLAPFSIPVAAAILSGLSIGNITLSTLVVEGFTSKRQRYFQHKCNHVHNYLNKLETHFIKCKEDGQITPDEFEQFQNLLKNFENEADIKDEIKSKDLKRVEKMAKKEIRKRRLDTAYSNVLQEHLQKMN
jgi:hypothetical protein